MAKRFPSQNSLVVDRAAIELDDKTGALRIILTDEELPAGLVLNVPKGGKIERTLLSLFEAPSNLEGASDNATPPQETAPSNSANQPVEPTVAPEPETEPVETVAKEKKPAFDIKETKTDDSDFIKPYVGNKGKLPKLDLYRKGNLISVVSPRAKTSKSTASLMLGAALARTSAIAESDNPLKVAVVDLDTTTGTIYSMVPPKAKGSKGVYESGVINIDTLTANMTYSDGLGVHILPISDEQWNALDWLGTDFLSRTVDVLRENFDVVIVDTPSIDFSYITQEVIDASDIIIITNTIERRQEIPTRQWLQKYFRLKRVAERATVLLTNTPKAQVQGAWEDVKRIHAPISIIGNIPMDSVGFLNAVKNNQIASLFSTGNVVADAYGAIADRLLP